MLPEEVSNDMSHVREGTMPTILWPTLGCIPERKKPKDMLKNVHGSFIQKSQKIGNSWRPINRSNNSKVHMTEYHTEILNNEHNEEWKKPDKNDCEDCVLHNSIMWSSRKGSIMVGVRMTVSPGTMRDPCRCFYILVWVGDPDALPQLFIKLTKLYS